MDIHKPKAAHSWREFLIEIGTIICGILIALGLEQGVEVIHWREKVEDGRRALAADFVDIAADARERVELDACLRRRLSEVVTTLNRSHGALPAVGYLGSPPGRAWYPASWDSLVATGTSTHLPRKELLSFSAIAQDARTMQDEVKQELLDWSAIYAVVGPGRTLEPGEAAGIRRSVQEALFHLNDIRLAAAQIEFRVRQSGLLEGAEQRQVDQTLSSRRGGANWKATCGPIAAPSDRIVDAPYDPSNQTEPTKRLSTLR